MATRSGSQREVCIGLTECPAVNLDRGTLACVAVVPSRDVCKPGEELRVSLCQRAADDGNFLLQQDKGGPSMASIAAFGMLLQQGCHDCATWHDIRFAAESICPFLTKTLPSSLGIEVNTPLYGMAKDQRDQSKPPPQSLIPGFFFVKKVFG